MSLRIMVGIAVIAGVLLAGSIIIIGYVSSFFMTTYFLFSYLGLLVITVSVKERLGSRSNIILALGLALIVSASMTYFADGARNYLQEAHSYSESVKNFSDQIDQARHNTEYFYTYFEYANKELQTMISNTDKMQAQADILRAQVEIEEEDQVSVPSQPPKYHEDEREEEDD